MYRIIERRMKLAKQVQTAAMTIYTQLMIILLRKRQILFHHLIRGRYEYSQDFFAKSNETHTMFDKLNQALVTDAQNMKRKKTRQRTFRDEVGIVKYLLRYHQREVFSITPCLK